ncbi:MAG TPA: phosphoethanolamine methyltransferase, partial [Stellaceae bacterium]|nr:phosphoethanolamine methyltransferase [Stellaceae bacterium]
SETAFFLSRWIKAPLRVGAVAPSSRYLGRTMAHEVDMKSALPVIELGGGTGSITQALLETGLAPEKLIVVERDARLHARLRERFPGPTILHGDAASLVALLRPLGITAASTVVSGLPLLSMPRWLRREIINQAFTLLGEDGALLQFTYSFASPVAARELKLEARLAARVWLNFPPAAIWRFRRHAPP